MKVLLVEDSPMIVKGLVYTLEQEQFDVTSAMSYAMAEDIIYEGQDFDLAILDIMLPDGDGRNICRILKEERNIPVIFLTAKDEESDVVQGLDMGADDYIIKPFRNRELISRINNVMRRTGKTQKIITVGEISVDTEKDIVTVNDKEVIFTALEYRILLMLFQNQGRTVTRQQILDKIWDMAGNFVEDNTLTVYIKRIRKKLGEADVIKTVKGVGYRVE
ncbi:MAG: response regulator transcription factor [Lachnospiraceae bacterium]|nr:response regulator transcription factor [Lachnospiraceae bacterium]